MSAGGASPATAPPRIVAVLTSHNRKALTLRCLERTAAAAAHAGATLAAVLVDDGSSDGTAAAVAEAFPWVHVERGDGTLFWNRGMHRAMAVAMTLPHEYLLWINDDTDIESDTLARLLGVARAGTPTGGLPAIVVGSTADRSTGRMTYGGVVAASRWRPFDFSRVDSPDQPSPCDTMNGNCVLLPAEVVRAVGNLDPVFEHSMGDLDYGLRARKLGIPILAAPGFVGWCSHNPVRGGFLDPALSLRERWRIFVGRKVLPPRSWCQLTRKHGGVLWPLHFVRPYVGFVLRAAFVSARRPPQNQSEHG